MATLSPELLSVRSSLDAQSAALSRVLENVRHQYSVALRLRSTPGWRGSAERGYSARLDDLADVLARGCAALERAVSGTNDAVAAIGADDHVD